MSQGIDKGAFLSIKLIRVNDFSRLSGFSMNDFSPVGLFVESQVDGQFVGPPSAATTSPWNAYLERFIRIL